MLLWVAVGLVALLAAVLAIPLLIEDEPAPAGSALTTSSIPVTTALSASTNPTEPSTSLPPTTVVEDLTQARNRLASVLASVGPPELKPKDQEEILKKVDRAIEKARDEPGDAVRELGDAAKQIRDKLEGDPEQQALAALDQIAAALGLELSQDLDDSD
jgi:hypothetical protein